MPGGVQTTSSEQSRLRKLMGRLKIMKGSYKPSGLKPSLLANGWKQNLFMWTVIKIKDISSKLSRIPWGISKGNWICTSIAVSLQLSCRTYWIAHWVLFNSYIWISKGKLSLTWVQQEHYLPKSQADLHGTISVSRWAPLQKNILK